MTLQPPQTAASKGPLQRYIERLITLGYYNGPCGNLDRVRAARDLQDAVIVDGR